MKKVQYMVWASVSLAAMLLSIAPAHAEVLFDFEGQPLGSTATVTATVSGLTVTVMPVGGGNISVQDTGAAIFGDRSLLPPTTGSFPPMIFNFSQLLQAVSIQFGDFNRDEETGFLTAYDGPNATGTVLGSDSLFYPASADIRNGVAGTLSVSASGIQSILVNGNGIDDNSLYWDNVRATVGVIPEPSSLALLGLGIAGLGGLAVSRRRRAAS